MVASELAIGVIGEFLNTGLKRAISAPFQRISRLQKVDHAARLKATTDPLIVAALDDYVRVIGSYHGTYTTAVDGFLTELESSGIVEVMIENALIGRSSPNLLVSFSQLHRSHFPGEPDPISLYSSMMAAFTASMRESSHDPIAFVLARSMQAELRERLDNIDACLASSLQVSADKRFDQESHRELLLRVARGLQQSYKTLRIETNRGPRNVEINRIYVPSSLSFREKEAVDNRLTKLSKIFSQFDPHHRKAQAVTRHRLEEDVKRFTYGEFADMFRRAVVLGDPGGGKSTLCQKFCYDMAKSFSLYLQFGAQSTTSASQRRLPIRIILRKFEQARSTEPQLTLLNYIVKDMLNYVSSDILSIEQTITHQLQAGSAVLAFDGLDEILDTSMRQEFCDLVTALCNQFPLCPVLVTSRFVGYDDARLADEFEEFVLEKFDDPEIESYVGKFMMVVGGKTKAEANSSSSRFIEQTKDAGADLRRNPLMLGLMGWLFLNNDDIPSNRPEIYKECATLMFERWDQKRGIIADDMSEFDRSQLFIHLASQIYGHPKLAAGVSKEWLQNSLRSAFFELYESNAKAFASSKTFVKFITGRAWIMSEVGGSVFAFTHQTFLEYFFARYLEDKFDAIAMLLRELKPRIIKSEWNEVTHLALQIKTYRSLRKQEEALGWLTATIKSSRNALQRQAILSFSARSLEYLNPAEAKISSFLNDVSPIILERASEGKAESLAFFGLAAHAARDRRSFIHQKITELIKAAFISNANGPLHLALTRYIGNQAMYVRQMTSDNYATHLPTDLRIDLMEQLSCYIIDKSLQDEAYARIAWQWYAHVSDTTIGENRLSLMYNSPYLGSFGGIDGLSSVAIRASDVMNYNQRHSVLSKEAARKMMSQLGGQIVSLLPLNPSLFNTGNTHGRVHVDFWKQAVSNVDDDKVALGICVVALLNAERTVDARLSSKAPAKADVRDWVEKWLKKSNFANKRRFQELARVLDGGDFLFADRQPDGTIHNEEPA
ncbi:MULTISPECIES: NACHT domain-containing protein [unclassified Sphingomonas]|uniref:NACHT domain-containing protein n=1 Tax=unclassified Sphingomonas TaxID=196159 RepID=UPI00226A08B8|nr:MULTISPECIES: NACHT domain-containing protein [unclassified Sphingomonas]